MAKKCLSCGKECLYEHNVCPICGGELQLVAEDRAVVQMGDGNALSGGIHSEDNHAVHDSYNQSHSHNATNSYNTTTHTTNNTTINEAAKSESERLQDNLLTYRLQCKSSFENGLITDAAERRLRELQVTLNLADEIVVPIKEEIKLLSKNRQKVLSASGRIDLRQTKSIIEQNTASALQRQLEKLEAWMQDYDDDTLKFLYFHMSSILESVRYTNKYEDSTKDEYWETYWAYIAYLLQNREKQANEVLSSLGRWHTHYPEQNDIVLLVAGKLMLNDSLEEIISARKLLTMPYTTDLQLLVDSIDELIQKDWEAEFIQIRPVHTFYTNTLFRHFYETQKEEGEKRRQERKQQEVNHLQEARQRQHELEMAQQSTAQLQAEADAASAQLEIERQNQINLEKEIELESKKKEAEQTAAIAAKAQEAAIKAEIDRKKQELKVEKNRRRKVFLQRMINAVRVIASCVILLCIILGIKSCIDTNKKHTEQYMTLYQSCNRHIEAATSDNIQSLVLASKDLKTMKTMKAAKKDNDNVKKIERKLLDKAKNLRKKTGVLSTEEIQQIDQIIEGL